MGDVDRASREPLVWLLYANRVGDNSQILALAEALGWPFEEKRFVYKPDHKQINKKFRHHLEAIEPDASSAVEAPWPDLVITASWKNEPIARYIQREADHPVRLVRVGRPYDRLSAWDLIITTPQYGIAPARNVLQNDCPLHRVTPERLAAPSPSWDARIAELPGPITTLLIGGNARATPFDAAAAQRLADQASAFIAKTGGSLLVSTSGRTPLDSIDAFEDRLAVPAIVHRFEKGAADNPYFAFLAAAEHVIVTAESVSMMTEACASGARVHLFDLGEGETSMRDGIEPWPRSLVKATRHLGPLRAVYHAWMRFAKRKHTRDHGAFRAHLIETGRACWLGDPAPESKPPPLADLDRAVARTRALFDRA